MFSTGECTRGVKLGQFLSKNCAMEIIAKAESIEQLFISKNQENVEGFNVPMRNSTEMGNEEWSKLGKRLGTLSTQILTSGVGNNLLA